MTQDKKNAVSEDIGIPVSVKIRERLKQAKVRFHANDNISEYLEPGDIDGIFAEVKSKMKEVFSLFVVSP